MPLSLAERVRERRNQRLADSQRRRALAEANAPATDGVNAMTPGAGNSNSANPLVPLLDIDSNPSASHATTTTTSREWGSTSLPSFHHTRPMSPDAFTPRRGGGGGGGVASRALVSPLNLPTRPPASPTQRHSSISSAPSSPGGGIASRYPPSPRASSSSHARNLYNSNFSSQPPRGNVVTPLPYLTSSSPSWEEDEGLIPILPLRSSDRSVSSELVPRYNSVSQPRSVFSESDDFADAPRSSRSRRYSRNNDVPMDERSTDTGSRRSVDYEDDALRPSRRPKPPSSVRVDNNGSSKLPPSSSESALRTPRMGGTVLASSPSMAEDDVSSLGGVEDQLSQASRTSVQRLTIALRANTPKGLMVEERALWEAFQASMAASRKAAMEEADPKMREKLKQQQDEQDKSFRAIQRVLADVSEDRDRATSALKESKQEQRKLQRSVEKLEEQVEELRDGQRQAKREADSSSDVGDPILEELNKKVQNLEDDKSKLATELESRNKQISRLKRHLHGKGDVIIEDSEGLKKELEERSAALENAKMIIASLENASNSLASDTRFKLKAKDAEIVSIKTDARHQQKKLDNLATQLKEVQREKAQLEEDRAHDMAKKSVWRASLREHLSDMQNTAIILEATRDDPSAMERFSQVVAEALDSMQKTVDVLDQEFEKEDDDSRHVGSRYDGSHHGNDMDSLASGRSAGSRMSRDTIKFELEEKSSAVRRLEEELKKVKEEAQNSRLEAERIEQQRESDTKTLYGEIQMLRIQCNTNMELLAKKERELAVLRDSLKVEDDVGYISDDATDIDEEEEEAVASSANLSMTKYSASQTEALAALLAHGRGGTVDTPLPAGQATDTDQLRLELSEARTEAERSQKELKIEKESLANAKMIISSLEKANKSMMEDLRSRLQESNSAIHSLLEKSMESEKNARKLETELETLRRENEELLHGKGNPLAGEEKKEEFTEAAE